MLGACSLPPKSVLLLCLFCLHYLNRSIIYPTRIVGGKQTPIVVCGMALVFCLWNGWLQGANLSQAANPVNTEQIGPRVIAGTVIFLAGMAINWHADHILLNLRKPGETGYKIPYGGAYSFVSAANYGGEIIEWAGFALAAWSLPAYAFAFFTFCNIAPR